ncbi:MAG: hypothetical protein R3B47_11825 [Bacteroidia bacterium]
MNRHFLRRWAHFVVGAVVAASCSFILGYIIAPILAVPIVSLVWALTLCIVRKASFNLSLVSFIFVTTVICSAAFLMALLLAGEDEFAGLAIVILTGMGIIIGVTSAGAHDRFLGKDHPSLAQSAAFGAIAFLVPYLAIQFLKAFFNIQIWHYSHVMYAIFWLLIVGFVFSKETRDDQVSNSELSDLIQKIGGK